MDQPQVDTTIAGVKVATVVFGFFGSAISLSYAKELTRTKAVVSVCAGTITAVATTPLAMHYGAVPAPLANGISFLLGLLTMAAIPAMLALVERIKDLKLPQLPDRKE